MNGSSTTRFAAWIPSRFHPDNFTLFLIALSALGVALVLAREAVWGVTLDADSFRYIVGAQNLLAEGCYCTVNGEPYFTAPPLYPLLLAAASLGVFDPLDVAGPLNAAIFGLTIFVLGHWLRQRLHSRFPAVWACFVLALSLPLVERASWAISDPAFILLTTLALIQTDRFLGEGRTSSLVFAALFTALAWQTRYIGVAAPMLIGLLLLFRPDAPLLLRARHIAVFSAIAAAPMGLWMLRTYLFTGKLSTNQSPVDYPLSQALGDTVSGLRTMAGFDLSLFRLPSLEFLPAGAVAFALAALAAALILAVRGSIQDRRNGQTRFSWRPAVIFGGFAPVYLPLLVWASVQGYTHYGISPRYVAPLYIPLLTAAAFALDRFLLHERERQLLGSVGSGPILGRWSGSLPAIMVMAVLSLWPAGQVVTHAYEISRANAPGAIGGFGRQPWAGSSETMRYIRENPLSGRVYSNIVPQIYFYNEGTAIYGFMPRNRPGGYLIAKTNLTAAAPLETRLESATGIPFAFGPPGTALLEAWLDTAPDGTWVVWFNNWLHNDYFDYGVPHMRGTPGLEPVASLSDGVIFKVNRDYLPLSNPYLSAYESIVSGDAGEPQYRSAFDIYLDGTALTYVRRPCVTQDMEAGFFLHLIPSDMTDLPSERVRYGFDNLDFGFADYGVVMEETCLAVVTLPGYDIDRIRTGQYVPGEGRTWEAVIGGGGP